MSGKVFAQIVALIVIGGAVYLAATLIADWRRNAQVRSYLAETKAPAPEASLSADDPLMGNDINAIDVDTRDAAPR